MAIAYTGSLAGELNGPVGKSARGLPIYLYEDRRGTTYHVVQLPDGRLAYSDSQGNVRYPTNDLMTGAMLLGIVGLVLGGPVAGLVGAGVGAVAGKFVTSAHTP